MGPESVVVLAIIDAVVVAMFFLFRVLPWSKPGPWRLIWITASLAFMLFSLGEASAIIRGGAAVSFEVQGPLFGAILATTTCLILVYLHGTRINAYTLALALTDDLTKLPNARAFTERVEAQLRSGDSLSLAYIRLEGLGDVNDIFGAHRGDSLLRSFADLLRTNVGADDFVGRIGGDKFGVILVGPDDRAVEVTKRIQQACHDLALREAGGVEVLAAVGLVPRTEASDPGRLIRLAYRAMVDSQRGRREAVVPSSEASRPQP